LAPEGAVAAASGAGVAAGAGVAEAAGSGVAVAAGAGAAEGAGVGDGDCARVGAGAAKAISPAIASAGAKPDKNRDNFIFANSKGVKRKLTGGAKAQRASSSFSPVRIRTAESKP
jgi:hypothetical protein